MFTVILETGFNASHAVMMPDGKMEESHQHNWQLLTAVSTGKLDKLGFAVEFGQLESAIKNITSVFENHNMNELNCFGQTMPTTEIVAQYIFRQINKLLAEDISLDYVELTEAKGCKVKYSE